MRLRFASDKATEFTRSSFPSHAIKKGRLAELLALETYVQGCHSSKTEVVTPFQATGEERHFWHAVHHGVERLLTFYTGQSSSEAKVCSVAEREMVIIMAGYIKDVGIGEALGIAVR